MTTNTSTVYLSRRNLLALLSKLDRKKTGETTACTLIKYRNSKDPYQNTEEAVTVVAVEDKDFYVNREAGEVVSNDDPECIPTIASYESFLNRIDIYASVGNHAKVEEAIGIIRGWSYAHRSGNGGISDADQEERIAVYIKKMKDY